ncbi:shikimate kinase [Opitutia bacterium]|nr:shikimate kinase [Opitutae bacterium]
MSPVATKDAAPNLLLAGFMGTGKSALGRQLAKRWRRPFLDTDELVEKLAGTSIADIFAEHGEEHFRAWSARSSSPCSPPRGPSSPAAAGSSSRPAWASSSAARAW